MMSFRGRIKQAWKSFVRDDATAYPQGQGNYNEKATDFIRLSVYGVCGNAPKGSHVFLIGSQGMESTKFGIENDFLKRLKGLKSGEVALYNTLTESYVFLKENGDVDVKGADINAEASGTVNVVAGSEINLIAPTINLDGSSEINLTAPTINLDGDVITTGDVTSAGTVEGLELTDGSVPYSSHKHGGVQTGIGDTEGPKV